MAGFRDVRAHAVGGGVPSRFSFIGTEGIVVVVIINIFGAKSKTLPASASISSKTAVLRVHFSLSDRHRYVRLPLPVRVELRLVIDKHDFAVHPRANE